MNDFHANNELDSEAIWPCGRRRESRDDVHRRVLYVLVNFYLNDLIWVHQVEALDLRVAGKPLSILALYDDEEPLLLRLGMDFVYFYATHSGRFAIVVHCLDNYAGASTISRFNSESVSVFSASYSFLLCFAVSISPLKTFLEVFSICQFGSPRQAEKPF